MLFDINCLQKQVLFYNEFPEALNLQQGVRGKEENGIKLLKE